MVSSSSPVAPPQRAAWRWLPALLALYALLFVITGTWFLRKYLGPVTWDQALFHLQHGGLDYSDPRMLSRAWRYLGGTLLLTLLLLAALRCAGRRGCLALWGLLGLGAAASVAATVKNPCLPGDGDYLARNYVDPSSLAMQAPAAAQRPDILLVFVESLDEAYTRPRDAAEAPLPRLSHWHEAHQTFGALRNLSGASWTVGGLFSALCGVPLQPVGLMSRQSFEYSQQFFDQGRCLTDLLAAQGWDISFYGGASLQFAGKGRFLASHRVQRRFGREQWQARGVAVPAEGWGLLDSTLSEQAWVDMNRPRRADEPRMHIVLTVNTHGPAGSEDPGCAPPRAEQADVAAPVLMGDALRCTDRMIEQLARRFAERADGRPKVVWIMGDHLAPQQLLADRLMPPVDGARTVFHVLARFDGQGRELPAPDAQRQFSHVDVLPTLAEAAGLSWAPQAHRLGLGVSLLAPGAPATLVERDGFETADGRLACHSPLFARLWGGDAVGD